MVKGKAPIVLGVLLFAGAILAVALLGGEARPTDLMGPASAWVRERYEKLGHKLAPSSFTVDRVHQSDHDAFVRVQLAAPLNRFHYLALRRNDSEWTVTGDMADHFDTWLKESKTLETLQDRLMKRVAERHPQGTDVRDLRPTMEVVWDEEGKRFLGFLTTDYKEERAECRFLETYFYKDGQWTRDGNGQVFVSPGRAQ